MEIELQPYRLIYAVDSFSEACRPEEHCYWLTKVTKSPPNNIPNVKAAYCGDNGQLKCPPAGSSILHMIAKYLYR